MSLETTLFPVPPLELPAGTVALLRRADEVERDLAARLVDQPPGGFHRSDYVQAYAALSAVRHGPHLRGHTFCEWGSGSGVVTLLADSLGFRAHGIEIQGALVELARDLGSGSPGLAEFACGTFVSRDLEDELPGPRHAPFLDASGEDGHDLLQLDPGEVDLVYCYPWPGEESWVEHVFDLCATPGAQLLTFHGNDGFQLHRKTDEV